MHLAHLEAEFVAQGRVLRAGATRLGLVATLQLHVTALTCKGVAPCPPCPLSILRPVLNRPHPTEHRLPACLRLLPGPTKLKEYESKEKLASRARSESSTASALVPDSFSSRGPRMSATVMSHFDCLSLTSAAARFATGCMSSAVSISCASRPNSHHMEAEKTREH